MNIMVYFLILFILIIYLFNTGSVIEKFMILLSQILFIRFFLIYRQKRIWLIYLISITFSRGLIILFIYVITVLKTKKDFSHSKRYKYVIFLYILRTTSYYHFDYNSSLYAKTYLLKTLIEDKNITTLFISAVLLTMVLIYSNSLLKNIKFSLRKVLFAWD